MPKMMKNVQQIRTIFPIGRSDDSNVCTTNFRPGARLITRNGRSDRNKRNTLRKLRDNFFSALNRIATDCSAHITRKIPKILGLESLTSDINKSIIEILTSEPSIIFHPELKYASSP